MRLTIFSFLLAATIAASAQNLQHHKVNVGDFTHLVVKNAINVDYVSSPDSAGYAVFHAPAEIVNCIMFSNNSKGKLSIETDLTGLSNPKLPRITIYSNYLEYIENSGDSTVRAIKIKTGPKFQAKVIGNGRLSIRNIAANEVKGKVLTGRGQLALTGSCTKANLSCTGVGAIQADDLEAIEVTATVNGTGSIGCFPKKTMTYKGMGPGTIYYIGQPDEIKNRSINVKLNKLD